MKKTAGKNRSITGALKRVFYLSYSTSLTAGIGGCRSPAKCRPSAFGQPLQVLPGLEGQFGFRLEF